MPTARVADSYGDNPSEHKPSQDPFDPETADEKQAETGGAEPWDGNSTEPSSSSSESSSGKNRTSGSSPAPTTANRTAKDRTGGSTAR